MSNQHEQEQADNSEIDMPPPQEEMRAKSVKKSNRLVVGGFIVIAGVLGYFLVFAGAGSEQAAPVSTQDRPGQQGPGFLTEDRGGPATRSQRTDNDEGGVGRERADVLSEIDEREDLLARIERGETAVMFEELDIVEVDDEDLEEYQAEPPVFGDLTPRERPAPAPQTASNNRNTAMTNTPSPLRPQPSVDRAPAPANHTAHSVNPEAVAYELGLMEQQRGRGANTNIAYTSYTPPETTHQQGGGVDHPMTPGVNSSSLLQGGTRASAEGGRETLSQGELAMPGDKVVAYLSTRISSDQPGGRAMAEILEGPLRGGKLLGAPQFQGERLLVNFNQLVYEGFVYDVEALAVDTNTLETSVADGINRRLLTRYGVPILAGVASIGIDYQAERRNPSVTQTNEFTGETITRRSSEADSFGQYALQESTDSLKTPLSDIASNAANTPVHVWADPGAIGVLFVSSVPQG